MIKGAARKAEENEMKRVLITPRNNNQFKKWGWLTFAIIIAMSSSG